MESIGLKALNVLNEVTLNTMDPSDIKLLAQLECVSKEMKGNLEFVKNHVLREAAKDGSRLSLHWQLQKYPDLYKAIDLDWIRSACKDTDDFGWAIRELRKANKELWKTITPDYIKSFVPLDELLEFMDNTCLIQHATKDWLEATFPDGVAEAFVLSGICMRSFSDEWMDSVFPRGLWFYLKDFRQHIDTEWIIRNVFLWSEDDGYDVQMVFDLASSVWSRILSGCGFKDAVGCEFYKPVPDFIDVDWFVNTLFELSEDDSYHVEDKYENAAHILMAAVAYMN